MRTVLLSALFVGGAALVVPSLLYAQTFEAGGSIGMGSPGSEGSLVLFGGPPVGAVFGAVWLSPNVEIGGRVAWMPLSREGASYGCNPSVPPCSAKGSVLVIFAGQGPRTLSSGYIVRHFAAGRRVRPFIGGGIGSSR